MFQMGWNHQLAILFGFFFVSDIDQCLNFKPFLQTLYHVSPLFQVWIGNSSDMAHYVHKRFGENSVVCHSVWRWSSGQLQLSWQIRTLRWKRCLYRGVLWTTLSVPIWFGFVWSDGFWLFKAKLWLKFIMHLPMLDMVPGWCPQFGLLPKMTKSTII